MPLTGKFSKDVAELIEANQSKKKKRPMKQVYAIAASAERKKK